jgi:hypothetical protein
MFAHELEREGIPVVLTIQVDSVRKNGEDDSGIPGNVVEGVNFYQTKGLIHGRTAITAADPSRTTILGNVEFKYEKKPAACRAYPWYDRILFKSHTAIECDPRVWSQVQSLIETRLKPSAKPAQEKPRQWHTESLRATCPMPLTLSTFGPKGLQRR